MSTSSCFNSFPNSNGCLQLPNSTSWWLFLALSCHICHMSAIRSEFFILVIESSIVCCHRVHGISFQVAHSVFQSLPLPWELFSFTNSNLVAHYIMFNTTSSSNNVTSPMCSNSDEYHAKCARNLVTQRLHKLPSVFMNPCHIIFLAFIIYVTHLNVNMVNKCLLGL